MFVALQCTVTISLNGKDILFKYADDTSTLFFFYKNIFYKNIEAKICEILRIFEE